MNSWSLCLNQGRSYWSMILCCKSSYRWAMGISGDISTSAGYTVYELTSLNKNAGYSRLALSHPYALNVPFVWYLTQHVTFSGIVLKSNGRMRDQRRRPGTVGDAIGQLIVGSSFLLSQSVTVEALIAGWEGGSTRTQFASAFACGTRGVRLLAADPGCLVGASRVVKNQCRTHKCRTG